MMDKYSQQGVNYIGQHVQERDNQNLKEEDIRF